MRNQNYVEQINDDDTCGILNLFAIWSVIKKSDHVIIASIDFLVTVASLIINTISFFIAVQLKFYRKWKSMSTFLLITFDFLSSIAHTARNLILIDYFGQPVFYSCMVQLTSSTALSVVIALPTFATVAMIWNRYQYLKQLLDSSSTSFDMPSQGLSSGLKFLFVWGVMFSLVLNASIIIISRLYARSFGSIVRFLLLVVAFVGWKHIAGVLRSNAFQIPNSQLLMRFRRSIRLSLGYLIVAMLFNLMNNGIVIIIKSLFTDSVAMQALITRAMVALTCLPSLVNGVIFLYMSKNTVSRLKNVRSWCAQMFLLLVGIFRLPRVEHLSPVFN